MRMKKDAPSIFTFRYRLVLYVLIIGACLYQSLSLLRHTAAEDSTGEEENTGLYRRLQTGGVPRAMTLEERKGIDRGGNTVGTDVEGHMVSCTEHICTALCTLFIMVCLLHAYTY